MFDSNIKYSCGEVRLLVDSGSTKTDWCVVDADGQYRIFPTQGINPFHQKRQDVCRVIAEEFFPKMRTEYGMLPHFSSVCFYGAGCCGEGASLIRGILEDAFPENTLIKVYSDLMAAARAVCGNSYGIACILGTGANSCLYDGRRILRNVSPLGYILGDEGSGAVLGKLFLNELLKGDIPKEIREEYFATSHQTLDDIIRKVYREPMANRWLASLSPFIHSHLYCVEVRDVVINNFMDFFRKNVDHYGRNDLVVGAVGSVAYYYKQELVDAAHSCGYKIGKVLKSPFEGLVDL